jgi:lipopolysaccharide export system protein LptA
VLSRRSNLLPVVCTLLLHAGAAGQESRLIVLEHADSLVGRVIDGEEARELIGNVRISQEDVRIACDRALQFVRRGVIELHGNVTVRDDTVTIRTERGIYHREQRRAEAFDSVALDDGRAQLRARYGEYFFTDGTAVFRGDVEVRDTLSMLRADYLQYLRRERRSVAAGNVILHSIPDNVTIGGERLENDRSRDYARVTGRPVLVQLDTTSSGRIDTLVVLSTVMESFRDTLQLLVATDSVRIVRGSLAATAERALYYTRRDSILLRETPRIWYSETQVSGDSIDVSLQDQAIRRVDVLGDAFAISRSDSTYPSRFDQLSGDRLIMEFEDRALRRMTVDTRATSVYFLYEDSLANGLNRSSGDRIILEFEEGRVSTITMVGGVEGQYVPEPLVLRREEEYRLPGFLWDEDRPVINTDTLPWNRNRATLR